MNGLSSIATFGAGNRQAWLVDALSGRDVVIATDDDRAGDEAERELRRWLRFGTEMTRMRFDGYKDAAEMFERFPEKFALRVEEAIRAANPLHRAVTSALEAVSNLDLLDYAVSILGEYVKQPQK
jgi:DNA primase